MQERIALGYARLSSEDLNAMTPRELAWRIQAEIERENRELERTAQLACWVINPWLGRGRSLRVRDLIRRKLRKATEE